MANIALLTTFEKFDPWYSLTGIVKDQVQMLTEYGHEVFLFVRENFQQNKILGCIDDPPTRFPFNTTLVPKIPITALHDYQTEEKLSEEHEAIAKKTCDILIDTFTDLKIDNVFTHDIIFTGWNKPYAIGIQQFKNALPDIQWFHWIHSVPSQYKDWWHLSLYGQNHWIVYPNKTDRHQVAENYRCPVSRVKVIPHIKDLRIMFDFDPATRELIDHYPALMQADIVQVYPASSDRFESKGADKVIKIMGFIKSLGVSVCLFIANQWATTQEHYANLQEYYKLSIKYGLIPGKDIMFSSLYRSVYDKPDAKPPYQIGVPSKILTQLMQLSNLFIFPTNHESFGLVLPEVSLASGALCVLNRSLQMQYEISGSNTLFIPFGSNTNIVNKTDEEWDDYLRQIAIVIMGRFQENDTVMTRTHMRKRYNYDYLYSHFYAPSMMDARCEQ